MRLAVLVRSLLFFGLLGPPIGGVVATFIASGFGGITSLPIVMVLSYIFGLVPALLVGAVAAGSGSRITSWASVLLLTTCGAVFSVLFLMLTGDETAPLDSNMLKMIAAPGAVSACVLASAARLRPNNSFKPRPLRGSA